MIDELTGSPRHPADEALIVRLGDQLYVFRELDGWDTQGPQCISALARSPRRCKNTVQNSGHYNGWSEWPVLGWPGEVWAMEPGSIKPESFIEQRCVTHLGADTPNVIEPTWTLFNPENDSDLIRCGPVSTWTPEGIRLVAPELPLRERMWK